MQNVSFEDDLNSSRPRANSSVRRGSLSDFLVRKGIFKSTEAANIGLICFTILCIIFAVFLFMGLNSEGKYIPYKSLPENVKAGIPPMIRSILEKQ